MALNGTYTTIDTVLSKVRRDSRLDVDEADAVEWIAEVMEMVSSAHMLSPKVTDGNKVLNHHAPVEVVNYRAKLPCDVVVFTGAVELGYFKKLRPNFGTSHLVNMSASDSKEFQKYTPDYWATGNGSAQMQSPVVDGTYQLKDGYIYTDFEAGHLIVAYKGWPMDEEENILIPGDAKVVRAMASCIQMRMDYMLWRSGDIPDKVWNDSEQNYFHDIGAMDTHAVMPSQDEMHAISNFMKQTVVKDHYFQTHFSSLGRQDKFRTH